MEGQQDRTLINSQHHTHTAGGKGEEGLRLLSLDGGGIRGISTLLVLQRLMEEIDAKNPPKPCDYFDMIGGTSTGGLIALMLGRMRLSVAQCIKAYEDLSRLVFTKQRHRVSLMNPTNSQGRFDHVALEREVKLLLKKYGLNENALLKEEATEGDACKTFVCATSQSTGKIVVLSSYYNSRRGWDMLNKAKIWEAARATAAATTFFEPISIDGEVFLDGATGANNPIAALWTEVGDVSDLYGDKLEQSIRCIVSIGTGVPSLQAFGPAFKEIAKALVAISTDTEDKAEDFERQHTRLFQTAKAFRFNVDRGLEKIGLEEVAKWPEIQNATRLWIQKQAQKVKIESCAVNLREQTLGLKLIQNLMIDLVFFDVTALNNDILCRPQHHMEWLTHTQAYESWVDSKKILWYRSEPGSNEDAREAVAAAVAHQIAERPVKAPAGALFSAKQQLANVLYFQCDRHQLHAQLKDVQIEAPPGNTKIRIAKAETIVKSLICQLLLIWCADIVCINNRISMLDYLWKHRLLEELHGRSKLRLEELFDLFVELLKVSETPDVLAIDNVHLIDNPGCASFLRLLRATVEKRLPNLDIRLPTVVSGAQAGICKEYLFDVHCVKNDSELNECIESLRFSEWDTRVKLVADAANGTNNWLWSHPQYRKWQAEEPSVLWIEGKPGSGKSVLARSILRRLGLPLSRRSTEPVSPDSPYQIEQAWATRSPSTLVTHWFYSSDLKETGKAHDSLMRSILYQMLVQDPALFEVVAPHYRRRAHYGWSREIYKRILCDISRSGKMIICVVDAVDEAEDSIDDSHTIKPRERVKSVIEDLLQHVLAETTTKFKFIILSRPQSSVEEHMQKLKSNKIVLDTENKDDISVLVKSGLEALHKALHADDLGPPASGESSRTQKRKGLRRNRETVLQNEKRAMSSITTYLEQQARGVILWVTLILGELKDLASNRIRRPSPNELEEHAKSLPKTLRELYQSIVTRLQEQSNGAAVPQARAVFLLITGSTALGRPLTIREMSEALAVPENVDEAIRSSEDLIIRERDRELRDTWVGYRRRLRRICGPLIEVIRDEENISCWDLDRDESDVDDISPDDIVQFMHGTVKDFLAKDVNPSELRMSSEDAKDATKALAMRYIEIIFPANTICYTHRSPELNAATWRAKMEGLVRFLEQTFLLQFACIIIRKYSLVRREDSDLYRILESLFLTTNLSDIEKIDWSHTRGKLRQKRPFYWWCRDSSSADPRNDVGLILLGELINTACSLGFEVATANVLEMMELSSRREWDEHAVANGALAAAIEHNLRLEAGALTQHQLDQAPVESRTPVWPIGRNRQYGKLDPVIRTAVHLGSDLVECLFEQRDAHFARQSSVKAVESGPLSLLSGQTLGYQGIDMVKLIYGEDHASVSPYVAKALNQEISKGNLHASYIFVAESSPPSDSDTSFTSSTPPLDDDLSSLSSKARDFDKRSSGILLESDPLNGFICEGELEKQRLKEACIQMAKLESERPDRVKRLFPNSTPPLIEEIIDSVRRVLKKLNIPDPRKGYSPLDDLLNPTGKSAPDQTLSDSTMRQPEASMSIYQFGPAIRTDEPLYLSHMGAQHG